MKRRLAIFFASLALAAAAQADVNVRNFGAKGDKKTSDRAAIQAAIAACAKTGGGVVRFPAGDYLSGQLNLAANITLQFDKGATLYASTAPEDYDTTSTGSLLVANSVQHIAITGPGAINGQAPGDLGKRWGVPTVPKFRTHLVYFQKCSNVAIREVSFFDSDDWTIDLRRCNQVAIQGVTIRNNYRRLNSDGIDATSCVDLRVSKCSLLAGDDAIVLKTTEADPCENITVSDCSLESASTALKLGTESTADFRNIQFSNCTIKNSPVGIGLYLKDGGTMEKISATRITLNMCPASDHDVAPLFIDIERRNPDSKIGRVRDVTFANITISSGSGVLLQGLTESPLENIVLRDIMFTVSQPDDYAARKKPIGGTRTTSGEGDTLYARAPAYAALAHIKNLTVDNFQVKIGDGNFQLFPRSALAGFHVNAGTVTGIVRMPIDGSPPALDLTDCRAVKTPGH